MNTKKFYLIYKITNNVNQKFYIGKHETNNLDDNYFGSGKYLNNAKEKYGLENFTKTILFYCQSKEEMNLLEHCVVTSEFCQREDVYNINEGGDGGWYASNNVIDLVDKRKKAGQIAAYNTNKKLNELGFTNPMTCHLSKITVEQRQIEIENARIRAKHWRVSDPHMYDGENNPMFGHVYAQETLDKMSSSKQGEKNNRYGSKWYYDPVTFESHSFLPDEEIPEGWIRGRKIKKK